MSKKIVEGLEALVLDIKVGKAAIVKSLDQALKLGRCMVSANVTPTIFNQFHWKCFVVTRSSLIEEKVLLIFIH